VKDIKLWQDIRIQIAAENNLSINKGKSSLRKRFYEYLKKIAIYGMHLPLDLIQLNSTERIFEVVHPID